MYFVNAEHYILHEDFCSFIVGKKKSQLRERTGKVKCNNKAKYNF